MSNSKVKLTCFEGEVAYILPDFIYNASVIVNATLLLPTLSNMNLQNVSVTHWCKTMNSACILMNYL